MKKRETILLVLVIALGLVLRLHNYDRYPQRGATSDEYTYSFLGVSLLTKGIPTSWSFFGGYPNKEDLTVDNMYFPIVWPYFDHPPLAGLIVGGWAILNGQNTFEKIKLSTIRLVPIVLSVVSTVLVFLIAHSLYGTSIALLASLIFSVAPIFVVQHRVVLAENFLTPIFLSAIYFYNRFRRVVLLGVISGIAFWIKESGITVFISLLLLSVYERVKTKRLLLFVLMTSTFIIAYLAYGYYYGWDIFLKIISQQSGREVGLATLPYILTTPIIINKIFYDGWYFWGFISLGLLLSDFKKHAQILVPAIAYLFFLLFFLTEKGQSGWYLITLFPFLSIASAYVLTKQSWAFPVFLFLVGFPLAYYIFKTNFGLTSGQYRIFLILLAVPWFSKNPVFIQKLYTAIFLAATIYLSYNYVHPS